MALHILKTSGLLTLVVITILGLYSYGQRGKNIQSEELVLTSEQSISRVRRDIKLYVTANGANQCPHWTLMNKLDSLFTGWLSGFSKLSKLWYDEYLCQAYIDENNDYGVTCEGWYYLPLHIVFLAACMTTDNAVMKVVLHYGTIIPSISLHLLIRFYYIFLTEDDWRHAWVNILPEDDDDMSTNALEYCSGKLLYGIKDKYIGPHWHGIPATTRMKAWGFPIVGTLVILFLMLIVVQATSNHLSTIEGSLKGNKESSMQKHIDDVPKLVIHVECYYYRKDREGNQMREITFEKQYPLDYASLWTDSDKPTSQSLISTNSDTADKFREVTLTYKHTTADTATDIALEHQCVKRMLSVLHLASHTCAWYQVKEDDEIQESMTYNWKEDGPTPIWAQKWFVWLFTIIPFPFFNGVIIRAIIDKSYIIREKNTITRVIQLEEDATVALGTIGETGVETLGADSMAVAEPIKSSVSGLQYNSSGVHYQKTAPFEKKKTPICLWTTDTRRLSDLENEDMGTAWPGNAYTRIPPPPDQDNKIRKVKVPLHHTNFTQKGDKMLLSGETTYAKGSFM